MPRSVPPNGSSTGVSGRIGAVGAWGPIGGGVTAATWLELVRSGGSVTANLTAPNTPAVIEDDATIETDFPLPEHPDSIRQELLDEAALLYAELVAERQELATEIAAWRAEFLLEWAAESDRLDGLRAEHAARVADLWTQAAFELALERARMQAELTARRSAAVEALAKLREQAAGARAQMIEFRDELAAERAAALQAAQDQAAAVDAYLESADAIMEAFRVRDHKRSELRRSQRDEAWDFIAIVLALDSSIGYRIQLPPPERPAPPVVDIPLTGRGKRRVYIEMGYDVSPLDEDLARGRDAAETFSRWSFEMPIRMTGAGSAMLDVFEAQHGETIYGQVLTDQERANAQRRVYISIGTVGVGAALGMAGKAGTAAGKASIRAADLPWRRIGARQAAKAIEAGQTSIKVASRDDAAEVVWRMFSSRGYINTTGRTGSDVRTILGSKAGTYHWDDVLDAAGSVTGHGAQNVHGAMRHVQIHLESGDIIRIFFP